MYTFSTYTFANNSDFTTINVDNKQITISNSELENLVAIPKDVAINIAKLHIKDSLLKRNTNWSSSTKITQVTTLYDNSKIPAVTGYSIELSTGYIIISAFADSTSLIPEWSDISTPLYNTFDASNDSKIIYLGGFEYYLDNGDDKVTDIFDNKISKQYLRKFNTKNIRDI